MFRYRLERMDIGDLDHRLKMEAVLLPAGVTMVSLGPFQQAAMESPAAPAWKIGVVANPVVWDGASEDGSGVFTLPTIGVQPGKIQSPVLGYLGNFAFPLNHWVRSGQARANND